MWRWARLTFSLGPATIESATALHMAKAPKKDETPEGDPYRGDEILRRMLKTKPKTHDEMVKERKGATKRKKRRG